jgi:hypothetical protein
MDTTTRVCDVEFLFFQVLGPVNRRELEPILADKETGLQISIPYPYTSSVHV